MGSVLNCLSLSFCITDTHTPIYWLKQYYVALQTNDTNHALTWKLFMIHKRWSSTHHRYIIRISYAQIYITLSYHEKIHIILLSILISQSREVEIRGKGLDIREEYYFYYVLYIVYNVKIFSTNSYCFYK